MTTTSPQIGEGAAKRGGALVEEEVRCGGGVVQMDGSSRYAARKQGRGKRGVNSSAIQLEKRLLKVTERAMNYMESRVSV